MTEQQLNNALKLCDRIIHQMITLKIKILEGYEKSTLFSGTYLPSGNNVCVRRSSQDEPGTLDTKILKGKGGEN